MRPHSLLRTVAFAAIASTIGPTSPVSAQASATSATAPQVVKHTVKKGDTLWDIAKFYLKDPFKWPEVFHANTDIVKNPHWIYPEQVLTIEGSAVRDEVAAQVGPDGFVKPQPADNSSSGTVFLAKSAPVIGPQSAITKPATFTVRPGEYEAAPFVTDSRTPLSAGKIVDRVEQVALSLTSEAGFKLYDRLYVTAPPQSSVSRGDKLVLAAPRATIADVGTVIQPTAILRVDSIGGNGILIGTIIRQFHDVHKGELTVLYDHAFSPTTVRPVAGTYSSTSKILWILGNPVLPSLQTYVVLQSVNDPVLRIGDQFTIYEKPPYDVRGQVIPTATATIRVVRITPFAVTGMIVEQSQPFVMQGMMARLTAKMM